MNIQAVDTREAMTELRLIAGDALVEKGSEFDPDSFFVLADSRYMLSVVNHPLNGRFSERHGDRAREYALGREKAAAFVIAAIEPQHIYDRTTPWGENKYVRQPGLDNMGLTWSDLLGAMKSYALDQREVCSPASPTIQATDAFLDRLDSIRQQWST